MRRLSIWLAAAAVFSTGTGAQAERLCDQQVHQKFDETRIYSRSFIASCKPGAQCRVVTHRLDKKAPLGFSHTMAFQRGDPASKWQIMLVDVLELADTEAGFALQIDKNPALAVSGTAISTPVSVNEYAIDAGLSDKALAEAKPGDTIGWSYTLKSGESSKVRFSLSGLTKAVEWAECAQAKLASGKSGPPKPGDEKPEFSPPEPDVPVDPIGDGRD
ncbi:MAG: hypothetical protein AAGA00_11135 [Pseudomonadota bacterium]